ncbi:acyl-[acyl-carrier-protein] thioesterase [Wukongibacter sp. M2B1]|uniref:acyl-[acyl-carrier-protein] thioesterase n=1 Tax=Wukongibacter sp. M2B1 TaxID=3088895 RepID=UPI003D79168E
MNLAWIENFKIHTYDTDFNNNVKLSSILNFMQEVATNHANSLKIGLNELSQEGLFWVLSRVKIEMIDFPKIGDEIKIETWPKGIDKLFALRDFKIYNFKGEIIGKATTAWLIIDSEKMRPKRPKIFLERIRNFRDEHALLEVPGKILESQNKDLVLEKRAGYTDIDINKHMNNVKYVELVLDSFSEDTFNTKRIKEMQINFLSEVKFGDKIQILQGPFKDASNSFYIEGIKAHTNDRVFKSSIKWRDI